MIRRLLKGLLIIFLIGVGIFLAFGTMDVRYENIIAPIEHAFVELIDEEMYTGDVVLEVSDLPLWCQAHYANDAQEVKIQLGSQQAQLAIFSDFVLVEKVVQSKKVLTGKLIHESRERHYKCHGNITIEPIAANSTPLQRVDPALIDVEQ